MAGAGFKTFNTGDVLTASDVNTYLMQQTVMVFASAAARSSALGANVAEGMLSYLKDTDVVEVYNGSAWVSSDDPNAIQNTIVDAKGDLISATAADTPARLAVGTDGQVLTADSSTATGLKWAAAATGGWTELASGSLNTSSSALNLTSISGSYRNLVLIVRDFYPASDDYIKLRVNNSSGTYVYSNIKMTAATTAAFEAATSNAAWLIEPSFDSTDKNNMIYIEFLDYAETTANKIGRFSSISRSGSDTYNMINQGTWAWIDTSAITQVNFLTNGANFSGGTYVLYGVK